MPAVQPPGPDAAISIEAGVAPAANGAVDAGNKASRGGQIPERPAFPSLTRG